MHLDSDGMDDIITEVSKLDMEGNYKKKVVGYQWADNCFLLYFQAQKNERESIRQKLALGSFFDDGPGIYTSCSKSGKPSLSSR
ncbi:hypothetical protein lerEdw1_008217 [Lerista edwardsae]|nr:hypothetical protein lerEdw1_008217 [Lerista edwardsae]